MENRTYNMNKLRFFAVTLLAFLIGLSCIAYAESSFQFALIGDIPRIGDKDIEPELKPYLNLLNEINGDSNIRFIIHVGDFKSVESTCSNENFKRWNVLCEKANVPFFYITGDNEWTDCHRRECGGYDPVERLDKLRKMFYSKPQSLGKKKLAMERQSDKPSDPHYQIFCENFRWAYGNVIFVGLNVQGSNNNFGRTPEADKEYALRNEAVNTFLKESFSIAKQRGNIGIMVAIQANPKFHSPPGDRTGFNDFHKILEEEAIAFKKPVVLVHGDTHYFRIDKPMGGHRPERKPFVLYRKRRIENFTRVETFGFPDRHWIRARVDDNNPNVFSFKQEIVEENLLNHK